MAIDKTPGIRYLPLPWDPGTKTEIGTATSTRKKSQYHVLLRACVCVCVMCKFGYYEWAWVFLYSFYCGKIISDNMLFAFC